MWSKFGPPRSCGRAGEDIRAAAFSLILSCNNRATAAPTIARKATATNDVS